MMIVMMVRMMIIMMSLMMVMIIGDIYDRDNYDYEDDVFATVKMGFMLIMSHLFGFYVFSHIERSAVQRRCVNFIEKSFVGSKSRYVGF